MIQLRRFGPLVSVSMLLTSTGCIGSVGDATPADPATSPPGVSTPGETGGAPTGGSPAIPSEPGTSAGCQEAAPLVTAARRLTREQYVNTVRDLLGDATASAGSQLPKDDLGDNVFADPTTLIVSPDWASSAMDAAEAAAKIASSKLSSLLPCDPSAGDSCVDRFIASFGKRAFRRPLSSEEVTGLRGVYTMGAKNGGPPHGIEVVVRALLQAPSFLYRLELGQKDGSSGSSVRLGPYEVASRLSYLMWNTMPDQALMEVADAGKLNTADEIVAQARRMLDDPRAHQTIGAFHGKWLGTDALGSFAKDPMRYPQFGDKLVASMRTELQMFVEDILFKGDGRLETLFNARHTFVDATLAPLYGVTAPASGFARVPLNPAQRMGILTNIGVITAHTYADESQPIHRGKFVRERFLCTIPPEPPADLMVEPPMSKPGVSSRQRLAEHAALPACKACHVLMDPLGFGFEAYDGLGRFRTTDDNGKAVDDKGVLDGVKDINGPVDFHGPIELGQKLAGSAQVRDCMVSNVIKFAQGLDVAGDTCVKEKLTAAFEASNHDIRELFIAVTKTAGFRFRRAIPGEVLP